MSETWGEKTFFEGKIVQVYVSIQCLGLRQSTFLECLNYDFPVICNLENKTFKKYFTILKVHYVRLASL